MQLLDLDVDLPDAGQHILYILIPPPYDHHRSLDIVLL